MPEEEGAKKRIGYRTPATKIEDEFEGLFSILSANKTSWEQMHSATSSGRKKIKQEINKAIKAQNAQRVRFLLPAFQTVLILDSIADLGIEMVSIHKRLAKCEQLIEELKLRTK